MACVVQVGLPVSFEGGEDGGELKTGPQVGVGYTDSIVFSKHVICSTSLFSYLFSVELSVMCLIHMSLDSDFLLERMFFTPHELMGDRKPEVPICRANDRLALVQHFMRISDRFLFHCIVLVVSNA